MGTTNEGKCHPFNKQKAKKTRTQQVAQTQIFTKEEKPKNYFNLKRKNYARSALVNSLNGVGTLLFCVPTSFER